MMRNDIGAPLINLKGRCRPVDSKRWSSAARSSAEHVRTNANLLRYSSLSSARSSSSGSGHGCRRSRRSSGAVKRTCGSTSPRSSASPTSLPVSSKKARWSSFVAPLVQLGHRDSPSTSRHKFVSMFSSSAAASESSSRSTPPASSAPSSSSSLGLRVQPGAARVRRRRSIETSCRWRVGGDTRAGQVILLRWVASSRRVLQKNLQNDLLMSFWTCG